MRQRAQRRADKRNTKNVYAKKNVRNIINEKDANENDIRRDEQEENNRNKYSEEEYDDDDEFNSDDDPDEVDMYSTTSKERRRKKVRARLPLRKRLGATTRLYRPLGGSH